MQTIEIDFGPPPPSFNGFAEAIAGAKSQPEQLQAKLDSERLMGSHLEEGQFGHSSCVLTFSNDLHLIARAQDFWVRWTLTELEPPPLVVVPPRELVFKSGQTESFDPNSMVTRITGSEFAMLAVTGRDLLVYTRGNEIFWLSACREKVLGHEFLYACFET